MRITEYSVSLEGEYCIPSLKKEKSVNYNRFTSNKITTWEQVVDIMCDVFEADIKAEEHLWMLSMKSGALRGVFELSHGNDASAMSSPVSIFKRLLLSGGIEFILVHNHPSQDCNPSHDDILVTERINKIAKMMEIHFTDHIILGPGRHRFSFRENGMFS